MFDAVPKSRNATLRPSRPVLMFSSEWDGPLATGANQETGDVRAGAAEPTARRVLIVDDDPSILRMLRLVFQVDGFEVLTATNGHEALDSVMARDPDVIVLDLEMPVMDGRTCFAELRARGHATPVLILSAHGAQRACVELQPEGCLSKPFDPEHLVQEVERLLEPR